MFIESGHIEYREATQREKKVCYFACEYMNQNNGIYVKELDEIEKKLHDYLTETDSESTKDF